MVVLYRVPILAHNWPCQKFNKLLSYFVIPIILLILVNEYQFDDDDDYNDDDDDADDDDDGIHPK